MILEYGIEDNTRKKKAEARKGKIITYLEHGDLASIREHGEVSKSQYHL